MISHRNEVVEIADIASLICEGRVMADGRSHHRVRYVLSLVPSL